MQQQQDWFTAEEMERIDREVACEQARKAIDKWKPRLEIIRNNPPRFTGAYIEGRA